MFGKLFPFVTQARYDAVVAERDDIQRELRAWCALGDTIRRFADGKETLGSITGRLNLLQVKRIYNRYSSWSN